MNNQLQKKNSLLKEICDVYEDIIIAVIVIPLALLSAIFIPYLLGRLLYIIPFINSLLHSIESKSSFGPLTCFDFWMVGSLPIIIISLLILATIKLKHSINVLKKTACLPTTEEELKSLNINTFDELDTFMLDFFGTHAISSESAFEHLVCKLIDCFKLLPLPEAAAYLESYEKYKDIYIDLRSKVLAGKIFKREYDSLYIEAVKSIQDCESAETKKEFAEEAAVTYIWTPGDPICPCCGEDKFKDLEADIWADWQPNFCPNCGAKMKKDVVERG